MAISPSVLSSGSITPSGSNAVTPSISPTANRILVIQLAAHFTSSPPTTETAFSVGGSGLGSLSWTRLAESTYGAGVSGRQNVVFWAPTGSSPGSGTITLTESDVSNFTGDVSYAVIEIDGIDLVTPFGTVFKGKTDNDTHLAAAIPGTPDTGDVYIAWFATADNAQTFTFPSTANWTKFGEGDSSETEIYLSWDSSAGDAAPNWTWESILAASVIGVIANLGSEVIDDTQGGVIVQSGGP